MIKLALIRHGKTLGNTQGRYIGTTDEPLCPEGISALQGRAEEYPAAELVFSSPMKRCIQTAKILYPDLEPYVLTGFRECDFGEFENKNYEELSGNPAYQAWIDSGGTLAFPKGESREQVAERTVGAFRQMFAVCKERRAGCVALVVHGGTIMTIMEQFASPKKDYYDWQVKNGCGFLTEVKEGYEDITISVIAGISP